MTTRSFNKDDFFSEPIEVLVVGGGPVGLSAAIELGLRGIKCVVVEPRKEISKLRPRAKTTNARSMEHFRRWNIAKDIRNAAALTPEWSQEVSFCTSLTGREITRFDEAWAITASPRELYAEPGQSIPQYTIEEVLREQVSKLETVRFAAGWNFVRLSQDNEKVIARLQNETNETVSVESKFLIGCDGARSNVRKEIGVFYEGDVETKANFNGVFRAPGLADVVSHNSAIQYWVVNNDAPGLMGRLDLKDTWWMMCLGVDPVEGNANPEKYLHGMIGDKVPVEVLATDDWSARMLLANHFQSGRVFLAGDAAHLNPPWGGLGFNTGLGDAVDIGWKLAAYLQGWGGEELLESYELERRPISDRVIKTATENMKTLSSELASVPINANNKEVYYKKLGEYIQKTKKMEFHSLGLVLGYRYDHSPVIVDDGTTWPEEDVVHYQPTSHPGARLPHTWLDINHSIYDELSEGFTLLRLDKSVDISPLENSSGKNKIPLKVVTIEKPGLIEKYEKPLLLVRPDQHVAWRGDKLTEDFDSLLNSVCGIKELDKSKI
ncbi:FAD-dependent monooxygenase [Neobacillus drentensis]|uniref:FAD-dependent monooxygenase n=1 Tax=Neobacillus drentensis TaxID=220684 RepID=UPI003000B141